MMSSQRLTGQVALITGAARRIGAELARYLHGHGCDVILHYYRSAEAATALFTELEQQRPNSVLLIQENLLHIDRLKAVVDTASAFRGRLDILVNNASSFYPTPLDKADEHCWDELLGTNLKAPFFLAQAAAPWLQTTAGCVVNLVDIHAQRPLKNYSIYSIAKAGNAMLVKALARELAPQVRVNGLAPGIILWPDSGPTSDDQQELLERTALQRAGHPSDLAKALLFLIADAPYMTGQILAIDGGRLLQQ
jgi:pteridine reductase